MCTLGSSDVRSPLPSLVTMTAEPVSATRKFAPVMPTSADRNFSRSTPRASATSSAGSSRRGRRQDACGGAGSRPRPDPAQMDRGRDDVARGLAADLHQIFAEIGLDHFEARRLEMRVEADLLRHHRLALGDERAPPSSRQRPRMMSRASRRGLRPVHVRARRRGLRLEGLEVEVEIRERMVADVAGRGRAAPRTRAGAPWRRALRDEPARQAVERAPRVADRRAPRARIGLEVVASR